ncbi:DUF4391 domain-containing protein [Priestia aryabhattai]|uniref:DUF4391 domain-containing protein n=1 Tax=Priestia aryabhattai TaxID=412384 RepID=UPI003D277DE5
MIESFYEHIGLSKFPIIKKRISKRMIQNQISLTKLQEKVFDGVERVQLDFQLTPAQLGADAFKDNERNYPGIIFIQVKLREKLKVSQLEELVIILNRLFPVPLVTSLILEDEFIIFAAHKRLSLSNQQEVVINEAVSTSWVSFETPFYKEWTKRIHIDGLPATHLYDVYHSYVMSIQTFRISQITEKFIDESQLEIETNRVKEIEDLQNKIQELKKKLKKEKQFNRKVDMNVKIHSLTKRLEQL